MRTFLLDHRRHVNGAAVVALALVTSIGVAKVAVNAQGNPAAAKVSNPVPVSPESIAAGKRVYTRYCAVCHGTNGEGGSGSDISAPAPDLTDKEWKHGVTAAVDVTLLRRFYERFADHAVEVARRVIFQVTGSFPDEEQIPTPH